MALSIDQRATVLISRVRQIDNLDPDAFFFTNRADFYPKVSIDRRSFSKDPIGGQDDVSPDDWFFNNQVSQRFVPITISLFDSDSGSSDEHVDINPASGRKSLDLTYDMVTGVVRDADTNEVYASSPGQTISLQGAGDGDRGAIEFKIFGSADADLSDNNLLLPPDIPENLTSVARGMGGLHFRGNSLAAGDFDNDGDDDLVVGAPNQIAISPSVASKAGGINVYNGSSFNNGITTAAFNVTQDDLRRGTPQESDRFGASVATGDFNNDGYDDVLVGVPFDKASGKDAGAVHAIYGSSTGLKSGLDADDDQLIHQNTPGIKSIAQAKEAFGNVLAVADFNDDGYDDAAIGVPFDITPQGTTSGGVEVIYGSETGLNQTKKLDQFFNQSTPGIPGLASQFEAFGSALAVGDFNDDRNIDLAIGVPADFDGPDNRAGLVDVIFGTDNGLPTNPTGSMAVLSQVLSGISARSGDDFGQALAVGDFNDDGVDDIAVGAPGRLSDRGVVYIYNGQDGEKQFSSEPQTLFQRAEMGSRLEIGDRFGAQLKAQDIDGDAIDDLVISAPGEDNGQGVAHLLFGSRSGITTDGNRLLKQGDANDGGSGGTPDNGDAFGTSLAIANFDGQGRLEIAASAPGENVGAFSDTPGLAPGAVNIIESDALGTAGVNTMPVLRGDRQTRKLRGGSADGILRGNRRNNRLNTGDGGDIALGRGGNDLLKGKAGDDLLDGGRGKDRYVGGAGADTFVLSPKAGRSIIRDFEHRVDALGLAKGLKFEDLTLERRGKHTQILLEDDTIAIVRGTRPARITANDFIEVEYDRLNGLLTPSVVI